jgi:hypothetical protein
MAARPRHLLDQAASRSGRSRALLHSSSNGSSELKSANLMGTNRELFAGAVSFDARDMASILSIKISASIVLLPGRGRTLLHCQALASADVMAITKWSI